ncbi:MAG: hypothetical protein LH478_14855 [Chitinophagaceae bacterium]|nr:hypothetical protein [Chitinophagaceae bacterium]
MLLFCSPFKTKRAQPKHLVSFHNISELLKTFDREKKLLTEVFEKRKIPYKLDIALALVEDKEERIDFLLTHGVLTKNGPYIELDDQYLQFFETILEVNEEINISYINENIQQVKQNILYHLQENNADRQYAYLKTIKNTLRKISRISFRNMIDLLRNIDNTFKTEPNYTIKIAKLEHYDLKRKDISVLLDQTELLITTEEQAFFTSAFDEELKQIVTQLRHRINELRHNSIELQKQIIDYLNQVKYHSKVLEKLKQVKYLKDQFDLKNKSDFIDILRQNTAVVFESNPSYPLKLSMDALQSDDLIEIKQRAAKRIRTGLKAKLPVANTIDPEYFDDQYEQQVFINLDEIKNSFSAAGNHLFDFIMHYRFLRPVDFEERVNIYCQVVSTYQNELNITEEYQRQQNIEFAMVYPK